MPLLCGCRHRSETACLQYQCAYEGKKKQHQEEGKKILYVAFERDSGSKWFELVFFIRLLSFLIHFMIIRLDDSGMCIVQQCSSHSHWEPREYALSAQKSTGSRTLTNLFWPHQYSTHTRARAQTHIRDANCISICQRNVNAHLKERGNRANVGHCIGFPWATPMRNFLHGPHLYRTNGECALSAKRMTNASRRTCTSPTQTKSLEITYLNWWWWAVRNARQNIGAFGPTGQTIINVHKLAAVRSIVE